jgi:hypothetical protein
MGQVLRYNMDEKRKGGCREMRSRFLERRVEVEFDEGVGSKKGAFELEYYLVESEAVDIDPGDEEKVFGFEIVKNICSLEVERECIRNFSSCRANTRDLLGKLADNTVTPVSLPFVLDDLIGM